MRLENQVALITGGGSGIGRESALLFASEGAAVLVVDVVDGAGQDTVTAIEEAGGQARFVHADVSKDEDYVMIETVGRQLGKIR